MDRKVTAFISCSFHQDDQSRVVEPLCRMLSAVGIEPVKLDDRPHGGQISPAVYTAIQQTDFFVAIATRDHAGHPTKTRDWIVKELGAAESHQKQIFIFCEDGVDPAWSEGRELFTFNRDPHVAVRPELADLFRQTAHDLRREEIGGELMVESALHGPPLRVRQLTEKAAPDMSGTTFMSGLQQLYEQLQKRIPAVQPTVYVGLNHAGMMAAAYLEGRATRKNRQFLGIIKTGTGKYRPETKSSKDRKILFQSLPTKSKINSDDTILLVDGQIKSGESSQRMLEMLHEKYAGTEATILYAAVVATRIELPDITKMTHPIPISDLFKGRYNTNDPPLNLVRPPDLLAFVSTADVRPPDGIP